MTLIYKILDNTNGDIYVGSTSQKINNRMKNHRADAKRNNHCSSKKIINNNDYEVIIIEECDEENRKEREQYWIDNSDCINIRNATFNKKEFMKKWDGERREEKKKYDKIRRDWKMSWGEKKSDICNLTYTNPFIFL
jgi:group I intron endonuclease